MMLISICIVCGLTGEILKSSKPLKFMHITKTGGSSIEQLGVALNMSWGIHHSSSDKTYGFWHEIPSRKKASLLRQYDWFTVVRNPYDRIVSEFWCQYGGAGRPTQVNPSNFNAFIMEQIKSKGNEELKGHYTPQYKYLSVLNIGPGVVLRVLRFEKLQSDFNDLCSLYNLPKLKLMVLNKPQKKHYNVSHLSEQTISLIQSVYKVDFEIFGYSMDVRMATIR